MSSPEPPNHRVNVTFRLTPKAIQWLDSHRSIEVSRTDVLKACLAVARKHETEVKTALEAMKQ